MINLLIRLFIRDHENVEDKNIRLRYGILAGSVGIFCNLLLAGVKVTAGFLTGAISVTADAANNLSDALSSIVTLVGFRMAGKPADEDHPYGHGRIEYISGFIVAAAIIAVAIGLLQTSVSNILKGTVPEVSKTTVVILIIAILVKMWMARFYFHISDRISSTAMKATARDSLSDCITTSVSLLSVLVLLFAGINIDGWAGALVSVFVFWSGCTSIRDTTDLLLGKAPEPELIEKIRRITLGEPEIIGVHDIFVHEYGPGVTIVSMHVEIRYNRTLTEAHDIIHEIENRIRAEKLADRVTIHIDPVAFDDPERKQILKETESALNRIDPVISMHDLMIYHKEGKKTISFDIVVPYDYPLSDQELTSRILNTIRKDDTDYEVEIDRGEYQLYSGSKFPER
ncbi:MAG: cation transporter [Erysipelotrichaceae bacterium]|nr:cation transporter [Erysipelotrichaceae bacterium]MBR2552802.1 cation transporter [Erysipelotrichaceae bacterium]